MMDLTVLEISQSKACLSTCQAYEIGMKLDAILSESEALSVSYPCHSIQFSHICRIWSS